MATGKNVSGTWCLRNNPSSTRTVRVSEEVGKVCSVLRYRLGYLDWVNPQKLKRDYLATSQMSLRSFA